MTTIPLPTKLEFIAKDGSSTQATVVLEPCSAGYGTTVGNALRRVLLSSLRGAAVTAVKIKNTSHEFSTIPHVKEDVVEVLLNVKQIRLKSFSDVPVTLTLSVSGARAVTAGDIQANAEVEVVNTDHTIATITDAAGSLEMEFTVERGHGYVPVESRDSRTKLPIGMIAVDAIYTPIVNVGYHVEHVRVGHMTDFEKLLLDVETDGTISVEDAVRQSAKILIDHFKTVFDGPEILAATAPEVIPASATLTEESTPASSEPVLEAAVSTDAPTGGEVSAEEPKKKTKKKKTEDTASAE